MKIVIEIPDYDGEGLDVIWSRKAKYFIEQYSDSVVLNANKDALISIGKQMIYMAYNNFSMGAHIHYDSFFTGLDPQCTEFAIVKIE